MSGVIVERPSPGIARLVLDRPDQRNALDMELARALREALDDAAADDEVRAVVLAANGPVFSVGGDIKLMHQAGAADRPELLEKLVNHFHAGIASIATMPKPVVAAVRGAAGGGGLSLALACDLVVVDEKCKLSLAFTGIGLSPDGGSTHHLPRLIGPLRAAELAYLNPTIDGAQALAWGLANRAVPADKVDAEALALVEKLASGATRAFARTKELLRARGTLAESLANEAQSIAQLSGEADAGEGIEAFIEKRAPRFRGR